MLCVSWILEGRVGLSQTNEHLEEDLVPASSRWAVSCLGILQAPSIE